MELTEGEGMHADLSTIDDFGKFEVCKQSRSYLFGEWGIHNLSIVCWIDKPI